MSSMKELLDEMKGDPISRMQEDNWLPRDLTDTEQAIDDDEEFQRRMGAKETLIECKYCGRWTKAVSSFCGLECKKNYIEHQKILRAEKKKWETRRLLNG